VHFGITLIGILPKVRKNARPNAGGNMVDHRAPPV
jgi:hypothetical protein